MFLQAGAQLAPGVIEALIAQRAQAKKDRDFAAADAIRQQLLAQAVVLKDTPAGTSWETVQ